ncbi:MAG: nucleoside hydrolase [Chthoniobacterales bacterium]
MTKQPVFFMQDGAIDELLCIPFVQSMPNCALRNVWVTPADCLGYPTVSASARLLAFSKTPPTAVFLSNSSSQRPFPWEYRQFSMMVNLLPALNTPAIISAMGNYPAFPFQTMGYVSFPDSEAARLRDAIRRETDVAGSGYIFLCTGPLTDLAWLLQAFPDLKDEIASIVWMGGSILKKGEQNGGNVDTGIAPGGNSNAEWNAYWDPAAVETVWSTGIPFYMFPLNVTNSVFLTPHVLKKRVLPHAQTSNTVNLAAQMYSMVAFQGGYSFWDTVTAAYLGKPDLFTFANQSLGIVTDESSPDLGNIAVVPSGGYSIKVAETVKVDDFYKYLVKQLSSLG